MAQTAQIQTWFTQDMNSPVQVRCLSGNVFSMDNGGNLIGVEVFRNGQPVELNGTVSANVIRADGATLTINGARQDNKVYVILPQAAYVVPGALAVIIKSTYSSNVTTLLAVVGNVYRSSTDQSVDPGTIMPSINTLIEEINEAVASIPADYSSVWTTFAPTFSAGTSYAKGQYVTYDGKLYQFTANHSGTWSGTDVAEVTVGGNMYVMNNVLDDTKNKTAASAYHRFANWFILQNTSFTSAITGDEFGRLNWNNNTPTTATYSGMGLDLGTYGDLKNVPYTLEITGDSSRALAFTLRLSKQGSWAAAYSPVVFGTPVVSAQSKYNCAFTPSDVLAGAGYSDSDHVFILIEQTTHPGAAVNVGVKLLQNAPNAVYSEYARHAGIVPYATPMIYMTSTMSGDVGAAISGKDGKYKISIPQNSGASGNTYGTIAFPAKAFVSAGNKLRFKLKKSNTNSVWNWDAVRLSSQYNNWGPTVLIQQLADSPGNVLEASYEVDLGSYGITPASYNEIYLIFDTFRSSPASSVAVDLTVEFMVLTGETVAATELVGFNPANYYNKDQIDEMIEQVAPDTDIIFWGDSLTAGAGGGGTTYPAVCANLLGKTHRNCGVGGEAEQTIAARQGGNSLIIPPGSVNGDYSFSEMLDETGKQILPLRQGTGSDTVNPVIINGQSCTLSLDEDTDTYTISGYTGTLAFATPALFNGYDVYGDITVIFVGANGLGSNTVAERISYIKSMISRIGRKYVVMGISYGSQTDRAADDAAMREAFGNHFFPTRTMLVNYGLDVAGITPTSQDEIDIESGTVPTSLRSDHIHLNASGYTALGTMLASFIVGLGYATYPGT